MMHIFVPTCRDCTLIDLNYTPFLLLALLGAIVANATGAGGGIVFVPAFKLLGIEHGSIIATSFAIQCFGMTAGSIAWYRHARSAQQQAAPSSAWNCYRTLCLFFMLPTIAGVVLGQTVLISGGATQTISLFKGFSAFFGMAILFTTYRLAKVMAPDLETDGVARIFDSLVLKTLLICIATIGGVITAWLSVGVGELIAIALILLRFPVRMAVGVAVTISAVAVWVGVQKYLWVDQLIDFNILVFAGPAAAIGGTLARPIASLLSPIQLKAAIAIWVLISAVAM